jgi:uncharacterized protein (DUF952 family)
VAVVVVATALLAGGMIAGAAAAGTDEQTAPNTADSARGQSGKPKAANTVKETGEGLDCMRRMRDVGSALGEYWSKHDGHLPPDLSSTFMHLTMRTEDGTPIRLTAKEKAERYLSPEDAKEIQVPEEPTPEWVNQHTSFVYLGSSDILFTRISNANLVKTVILYEKRKASYPDIYGRMPLLFVDTHGEAFDPQEADKMIAESKTILEAARVPATGPAK